MLEHAPDRQKTAGAFDDLRLKEFCRYVDLETAGLFQSRMTLDRAIARGDFPSGRRMGNIRIWLRSEIEAALAQCPTGKLPVRAGAAKAA
jgi:predicted DNA-binding transcriptional regulator AlpA